MIRITKRSRLGYPLTSLFFVMHPDELPRVNGWDFLICKQVSREVKEHCAGLTLDTEQLQTVVCNLQYTADMLWERIEGMRKESILRGQRLPCEIALNSVPFDTLYGIVSDFYDERQIRKPSREYLHPILEHSDSWAIKIDGKPVFVDVVMKDYPGRVRLMYRCHNVNADMSKTKRGYLNSYLAWHEMLHYQEEGFELFDWGGIFPDPNSPYYGITQFKRSFGGELVEEWNLMLAGWLMQPIYRLGRHLLKHGDDGHEGTPAS